MLRFLAVPLLSALTLPALAQGGGTAPVPPSQPGTPAPAATLHVESNIVFVPATVSTNGGEILYGLTANQFVLEDNGVPQSIRMDDDADSLGLSLAVVVQCSRSAVMEYPKLSGLGTMVESIVGGAPHVVTVITYGSKATALSGFSSDPDAIERSIARLQPCDEDPSVSILDAVAFAASVLDAHQDHYRHAILLIGETRDHGSHIRPADVVAALGRTNTVVDSVSFSPGKNELLSDLHYDTGSGPLGLLFMTLAALRRNVPKTLASLSGGEYINFTTQKGFDAGLQRLANHIHNYYLLSFQPPASSPTGLHALKVKVPDYPKANIQTRASYWFGPAPPQGYGK